MKTTMISVLAAALATVCSAAPTAVAVAQPLPAKFSLNYVPREGTALNKLGKFGRQVLSDANYGDFLFTGYSNSFGDLQPVIFAANGTGAFVHHNDAGIEFDSVLSVLKVSGYLELFPITLPEPNRMLTGFGQTGGLLTFDQNDGKGPQNLWKSCEGDHGEWTIFWNPSPTYPATTICLKIDLTIVSV